MPSLNDLEIKFDDAPMKTAMDTYYAQLLELIPIYEGEKLCLGSTLVTLPFDERASQYNNFLIRLIADRVIDYGSPKKMPENVALGSLDTSEHFSARYRDFAQLVLDRHLAALPTEQLEKYNYHRNVFDEQLATYNDKLKRLVDDWQAHREKHYPGKTDPELELERATYYNNRKGDFDDLKLQAQAMKRTRTLMGSILRTGSPQSNLALSVLSAIDDSDQYLPNDAATENKYQWDAVWLGNPLNTLGDPSYLDKRPGYLNTFDYEKLQLPGVRELVLSREEGSNDYHRTSWSASATARYGFFFKAKVSASQTTETTEAVKAISKVEIKFDNLYEVLVGRGSWYNKDIFDEAFILDGDIEKRLAARLKHAVKSVIIARGLKVYLHFEDEKHSTYFRQFSASGKAGFSFLGGLLPIGGAGNYNSLSKGDDTYLDRRIVSFADGAEVARMVGYRVESVHDYETNSEANPLEHGGNIPLEVMKEILRIQSSVTGFDYKHKLL